MSSEEFQKLLEKAKSIPMTSEQREAQRRSFAYGNSRIENERVTRETIDREAEAMARKDINVPLSNSPTL